VKLQAREIINLASMLLVGNSLYQGGNEVSFFTVDPMFVRKFLNFDSKSVTNFRPWSHKYGTAWSLKKLLIPDPRAVISDPILLIPVPKYLVTTLL